MAEDTQKPQQGVKVLEKTPDSVDREVLRFIPEEVARQNGIIAFAKTEGVLSVAMIDPFNIRALNALRFIAGKENVEIEKYQVDERVFAELLSFYSTAEKAVEAVMTAFEVESEEEAKRLSSKERDIKLAESIQDAPVAKLVHVVVKHAVEGRASDIHIEPYEGSYRVRFRVDGSLHASLALPKEVGIAVVSRVKIMSNLKIDERRKPQDGRFRINESGQSIDFRVSTLPVVEGEKVVMRILEKDKDLSDLKKLGLLGRNHEILTKRIREPFGIVLITGPTGSGKSTTLYAFLQILNSEAENIVTLEDPVEYFVNGINQSQIKPEIGYTFATGLRSLLRQDPNIIMVGEIRDMETAELAIHAALTGHLVFSTLHTNDAIGAIPRLIDMGIEPFLLSASLREVAAQRLVRRICPHCKEEDTSIADSVRQMVQDALSTMKPEEIEKYDVDVSKMVFSKGKGCDECGDKGYKGRVAIYEVVGMDSEFESLISDKGNDKVELEEAAKKRGMITMKQDGIMKVLLGLTTLAEVERVTEGSLSIGGKVDE